MVVITGATGDIGYELAGLCAKAGDSLVLNGRRENILKSLADDCRAEHDRKVETVIGDLRTEGVIDFIKLHANWAENYDYEDIVLVNNAGVAYFGDYAETDYKFWQEELEANLLAPAKLTHALLPLMLAKGKGRIINVLSIAVRNAFPGAAVYAASKSALGALGQGWAAEYRRKGIVVTNVIPGATDTGLWDAMDQTPPRDRMIPARAVADTIFSIMATPRDRTIEEIVVTPPDGVL